MVSPRKPAPEFAPGEPEAPVSAPQDSPGTGAPPDGAPANPDNQQTPETPEPQEAPTESEPETLEATPEATPEDALQRDLEQIHEKAKKADEYLLLAQRTKADFENYRKRAARDAAAAQERGAAKLAKELLPAVDNLDRALEAAQEDGDNGHSNLVSGIKLVHADVIAALSRAGIERFEPKGEQFDPQRHEAIAQQPVEGAEPGTIVEVYQRGYVLGDFVIRPARVVVAG